MIVAIAFVLSLLNHFGLVYRLSGGALGTLPKAPEAASVRSPVL